MNESKAIINSIHWRVITDLFKQLTVMYIFLQYTVSQNHKMFLRLEGTSGCTASLLQQGHLDQVAQDCVQMVFDYFSGGKLPNLSGEPVPVLHHSEKSVSWHLYGTFCVSVCASCLTFRTPQRAWSCLLPSDIYDSSCISGIFCYIMVAFW